jgi:hypothetical protein
MRNTNGKQCTHKSSYSYTIWKLQLTIISKQGISSLQVPTTVNGKKWLRKKVTIAQSNDFRLSRRMQF